MTPDCLKLVEEPAPEPQDGRGARPEPLPLARSDPAGLDEVRHLPARDPARRRGALGRRRRGGREPLAALHEGPARDGARGLAGVRDRRRRRAPHERGAGRHLARRRRQRVRHHRASPPTSGCSTSASRRRARRSWCRARPAPPARSSGRSRRSRAAARWASRAAPEKCRWLVRELGYDAAVDYKSEDVGKALASGLSEGRRRVLRQRGRRDPRRRAAPAQPRRAHRAVRRDLDLHGGGAAARARAT